VPTADHDILWRDVVTTPDLAERTTMDCWHREIAKSRTEAEVVKAAADLLALWSPRELAPVTLGWRPVRIESADDLERVKKWLVEDLGGGVAPLPEAEPLRELGDYLWHASVRIRELRRH
jgi:hypothetical protein